MIISTLGSVLEVYLIWGFAKNLWSLVIFSLAYGATAGGFAVLRPRFSAAVVGNDNNNEQSMLIFSVLTASRGSAIIASGFITAALVHDDVPVTNTWAAGKRYEDLVIYTGIMMFASSWGAFSMFVRPTTVIGRRGIEKRIDSDTEDASVDGDEKA